MKIKTFLSALLLMVSTMASAQKYLNVKLEDGTYRSFKATPNMEISFDKTAKEEKESGNTILVNGYKVTVKLADNTPASDVVFSTSIEGEEVKIRAVSITNKELICSWDEKLATPAPKDGFYTFTISNISNDVVATVGYKPIYTVKFDMNDREGTAPADMKVVWGKTFSAPTPTAALSVFLGWYKNPGCTTPYDFSEGVTADMTLYAKWTDGINGHAYVDLAGIKWATENVGGCRVTAVADPSTAGNRWGFYFYKLEDDDASDAAKSWGSETDANQKTHSWTLPSNAQWQALIDECYWEWTSSYNYITSPYNGMSGYIVYQAKSDADKNQLNKGNSGYAPATDAHIFLPAADTYTESGQGFVGQGFVGEQGYKGYYWSTVNYWTLGYAEHLRFDDGERFMGSGVSTCDGMPVRPVSD